MLGWETCWNIWEARSLYDGEHSRQTNGRVFCMLHPLSTDFRLEARGLHPTARPAFILGPPQGPRDTLEAKN